jgi:hypothetical protein
MELPGGLKREFPLVPLTADGQFFTSLVEAGLEDLGRVLADGFILSDVMRGSEIIKSSMLVANR